MAASNCTVMKARLQPSRYRLNRRSNQPRHITYKAIQEVLHHVVTTSFCTVSYDNLSPDLEDVIVFQRDFLVCVEQGLLLSSGRGRSV